MSRPRTLIRSALVSIALIAALAPAALAGGATTTTFRDTFHDVDDHGTEQWIFDVEAIAHITTRPDGIESVTYNARQVQTHVVGGSVLDVIESNSSQHVLHDGEEQTIVLHTGAHHRYSSADETCQTTVIWQIIDGEIVRTQFQTVCH